MSWRGSSPKAKSGVARMQHHLVVVREQYLKLLLSGHKRIECRLSAIRRAPYQAVAEGDLLWFKLSSGPVQAVAVVECAESRTSDSGADLVRWVKSHDRLIHAEPAFYRDAADWVRFATLVWLKAVIAIRPMRISKTDQRAWVALKSAPRPGMRIAGANNVALSAKAPSSRRPRTPE